MIAFNTCCLAFFNVLLPMGSGVDLALAIGSYPSRDNRNLKREISSCDG